MSVPDIYREGDGGPVSFPTRQAQAPDRLDLSALFSIFRRRFKLFFYVALIIFDVSALLAVYLPPKYTAEADVVINTHDDPVAPTDQKVAPDLPTSTSDVQTEIEVLTSRDLAAKVVDYLKLQNDPDMRQLLAGGMFMKAARAVRLAPPVPTLLGPELKAKLRDLVIGYLLRNLDVERLTTSFALSVSYTDDNPVRSAAIANAFAHLYTQGQIDMKASQNRDAARILSARIVDLQRDAQRDFRAVQAYRVQNNLLSTTGASLTEQEISAYNQQVATARAEAAEDAARLATARDQLKKGSKGDDVGEALSSPVVHALRAQRAELSAKVADYAGRYGAKNPDLVDTLRQLADVDSQIQAEINRTISNLDAKAKVSQQRVGSLNVSLVNAKGTLATNNKAMVELDDLQRQANTSQALYESYLNRYKEAVAASGAERADSRLVSDARIPGLPSFPKPMLFMALGLVLGIGAGVVAALVAEMNFSGLTTGNEVEERLGVPYWGGIPELSTVEPRGADPVETVSTLPRSPLAQAFRGMLGAVRQIGDRNQVIVVTSALPNEGKTTVSACLAQSAHTGSERTIVIDCDTINSQYSRRFVPQIEGRPGLREVLAGDVTIAAALVTDVNGVHVLPITTPFEKGELLLEKGRMQALVAQLREHFDLIILDTAPVLPVAESREITILADKVALVGQWRKTPDKALGSAIGLLPPSARRNTGVVLTRINMKKQIRFGYGDPSSFYRQYRSYYHA